MFYIIIVLLTTFFFYLAINLKFSVNENKKYLIVVFVALTVLIPSIVAGGRGFVDWDRYKGVFISRL